MAAMVGESPTVVEVGKSDVRSRVASPNAHIEEVSRGKIIEVSAPTEVRKGDKRYERTFVVSE